MFTKEQLEGVIISLAQPEISVERDDNQSIGYRIRLRVHFRSVNENFLSLTQDTLTDLGIDSYLIPKDLPQSNNKFTDFQEVLTIVSNKHHLTQKGFERVLEIKGILT